MSDTEWYWCLTHQRAERADERDDPDDSLGPYESKDAAEHWRERHDERATEWKAQDEAWEAKNEADG
ncbi:MAG: hypothetical protein M3Y04_05440 [Actinomycetota bacterium]|nr:hypothetical protein [Actinomycetota bacterium]